MIIRITSYVLAWFVEIWQDNLFYTRSTVGG